LLGLGETLVWKEGTMKNKLVLTGFVCVVLLLGSLPALAGDSLYGKITEVRSATVVVLENGGKGKFVIRLVGIDVPQEGLIATEAKQLVEKLVLGMNARMRLAERLENGEFVARLFTDNPGVGIRDVGLELLRAGLATRQKGEDFQFDYKYNERTRAENEARENKRGLWAPTQPR
jgi:endonuclease YncB( thermonuclease family)